jgi:tetratricopeptide (TPR) repeat protein
MKKDHGHLLTGTATTFRTFIIFFLLVLLSYSNTFRAAWHLDDYLILKGKVLMHCNDTVEALCSFRAAIRINPKRPEGLAYVGAALMTFRAYERSEKLLKFALSFEPNNLLTYLRLVDVNLRRGHLKAATALARHIVTSATVDDIDASLGELSKEPFYQGIEFENLTKVIVADLENHIPDASIRGVKHTKEN